MRIAQVAPLVESVPPRSYGGTELVVSYLTEELVDMGHDVTLFASADSMTRARLRPQCERSLRSDAGCRDPIPDQLAMLDRIFRDADEFEVVHFHTDYLHLPLAARADFNQVTTIHSRLDLPYLVRFYDAFRELPFISISDAQRAPVPRLNWQGTIHHGLPRELYEFVETPQPYLAFLGRIAPEKRADRAIEIARRVGIPLRIAAKIDQTDRKYFEAQIRPLLDGPGVEYIGEIGQADKGAFLGNAMALLFPIDWPEPFGLVMIEAMACGTPVIAFPGGAVPEVIDDGKNGRIVRSIEEAVVAVEGLDEFRRRDCRATFEERFSVDRMAEDHVALYECLRESFHGRAADPRRRGAGAPPRTSALRTHG